MDKPISSFLRNTFLVHMVIGGLLGAFIFLIPGRALTWLGWVPTNVAVLDTGLTVPGTTFVDPVIVRLVGAALLALAFSSFLGWRSSTWGQVALLVQVELVYCALSSVALITGWVVRGNLQVIAYVLLMILLAFVAAWAWAYQQGARE